jgi:hypothetical protein
MGGSQDDLELLKRMKIEVVISGTNNDDAVYKPTPMKTA